RCLGGVTLAAAMRARSELADTRIVLLTSGERARSQEPRDSSLRKPLEGGLVREALGALLTLREHERVEVAPAPAARATVARGQRILVAEDDEFSEVLLSALLRRRGHHVEVARDGLKALELAEAGKFDLLMLDLHMPGADGFEVIAHIRERERARGGYLPVIALTARSRKEDHDRCLAAGGGALPAKAVPPQRPVGTDE